MNMPPEGLQLHQRDAETIYAQRSRSRRDAEVLAECGTHILTRRPGWFRATPTGSRLVVSITKFTASL